MNQISNEIIRASVIGFVLPALLLGLAVWKLGPADAGADTQPIQPTQSTAPSQPITQNKIPVLQDGQLVQMELEEYLLGVVLAEIPASFEPDAIKAQAVAARTYALKSARDGYKHPSGAICTEYSCCQAYISPLAYLKKGGTSEKLEKVRQAVNATAGQVLTYDGELIFATYFSCSGGSTEDAKAVWGQDIPYLQAVESPGEENAAYYTDSKQFTPEEFQTVLGATLSGPPATWFGKITYTAGGGVDTMEIGGVAYRGTTLRTLLGLRSTAIRLVVSQDSITFETRGYGHRVGMSQYGADAMALTGSSYEEILAYYYQGTQLVEYREP